MGKFWETRSTFSKIHKFCWRRKNWHHLKLNTYYYGSNFRAGVHSTSIVVFSVGASFGKFDRPSSPYRIVYDKPRLDMVVFGKDLQSTAMSNTFDASRYRSKITKNKLKIKAF